MAAQAISAHPHHSKPLSSGSVFTVAVVVCWAWSSTEFVALGAVSVTVFSTLLVSVGVVTVFVAAAGWDVALSAAAPAFSLTVPEPGSPDPQAPRPTGSTQQTRAIAPALLTPHRKTGTLTST